MLKVLPIQTKARQEELCAACGSEFLPDALAYAAYADEVFCGVCQFKLAPEGGKILSLASIPGHETFQPMYVMGRAALSFMETCGAERAVFLPAVDEGSRLLVRAIGFRETDGVWSCDLRGMFDSPCSGGDLGYDA